MHNQAVELGFWPLGDVPPMRGFLGCASAGCAGDSRSQPRRIESVITGGYATVLQEVARRRSKLGPTPTALVWFTRGDGMERFLDALTQLFSGIKAVGGGAARSSNRGQVVASNEVLEQDVILAFVPGHASVDVLNVHDICGTVEIELSGPREIARMRCEGEQWRDPAVLLAQIKAGQKIDPTDFERLTIADREGRNVHLRLEDGKIRSGADMSPGLWTVRSISSPDATRRLEDFSAKPNSLVFGCAGLKGILDRDIYPAADTVTGFLFGEVVTLSGGLRFGNLMASRITFGSMEES